MDEINVSVLDRNHALLPLAEHPAFEMNQAVVFPAIEHPLFAEGVLVNLENAPNFVDVAQLGGQIADQVQETVFSSIQVTHAGLECHTKNYTFSGGISFQIPRAEWQARPGSLMFTISNRVNSPKGRLAPKFDWGLYITQVTQEADKKFINENKLAYSNKAGLSLRVRFSAQVPSVPFLKLGVGSGVFKQRGPGVKLGVGGGFFKHWEREVFCTAQVNNYMTFSGFGIKHLPIYGQRNDIWPITHALEKIGYHTRRVVGNCISDIDKPISRKANYLNNNLQTYEAQRLVAPPDCSTETNTNQLPFFSIFPLTCFLGLGFIIFSASWIKEKSYNKFKSKKKHKKGL